MSATIRIQDVKWVVQVTSADETVTLDRPMDNLASVFLLDYQILGSPTVAGTPTASVNYVDIPQFNMPERRTSTGNSGTTLACTGMPLMIHGENTSVHCPVPERWSEANNGKLVHIRVRTVDEAGAPAVFSKLTLFFACTRASRDAELGKRLATDSSTLRDWQRGFGYDV